MEILSGDRSIGGNFIRIIDGDKRLIFDQGIRFDILRRYYSFMVSPTGLAELRSLGVIPKPEWYMDVQDIYVTHMHLDHLGALSNIPGEATVHIPSIALYELMEEKWRMTPTWLNLIPRKYYVNLEEVTPFEVDRNGVEAIPVSHSAFPAYAYLYHGSDGTVLYTGDFRVESYLTPDELQAITHGPSLLEYFEENRDLRVDLLVMEGTNIGSSRMPISPREAITTHERIIENSETVVATLHSLDLEYAVTLAKMAEEFDKTLYVTSPETAKLLENTAGITVRPRLIEEYAADITFSELTPLRTIEKDSMIVASYRNVIDLLRGMEADALKDATVIISEPEPTSEEQAEYDVIANWMTHLNVQSYRIRVSGHYYPYQLKTILETLNPKEVKTIHTEKPELLQHLANRLSS